MSLTVTKDAIRDGLDKDTFAGRELDLVKIYKEYGDFDLDVGLPTTGPIELGGGHFQTPVKAFIAWRALSNPDIVSDVIQDPNKLQHVITYYDKYEVPTVYRKLTIKWNSADWRAIIQDDLNRRNDEYKEGMPRESFNAFVKRCLENYLETIGFIKPIPLTRWQKFKNGLSKVFTFKGFSNS